MAHKKNWEDDLMALIFSDVLKKELGALLEGASPFFVNVQNTFLSEAYDLMDGDEITGEIIELSLGSEAFPEFQSRSITLILKRSAIFDQLFISKSDWRHHFREWGIVTPGYRLELKLITAMQKATNVTLRLYSKRDVRVV